jgi:hypothetical protein
MYAHSFSAKFKNNTVTIQVRKGDDLTTSIVPDVETTQEL